MQAMCCIQLILMDFDDEINCICPVTRFAAAINAQQGQ
jgi:hypothetical protein